MEIPKEVDDELRSLLEQLTVAGHVLEVYGHGDKVLGHLSLRDPRGRGFWMKRAGISLAELSGPEDFVLVDFDGRKVAGDGVRHAEWPIHGEIFLARSDVNVIGHTHPYNAGVMATTEQPIQPLTRSGAFFTDGFPRFRDTSNLIIDKSMGIDLASALGCSDAVLMRNHGITFVGPSIAQCVLSGLFCEYACRDQLRAAMAKLIWEAPTPDIMRRLELDQALIDGIWHSLREAVRPKPPNNDSLKVDTFKSDLALANRVLANESVGFLNFDIVASRDAAGEIFCGRPEMGLGQIKRDADLCALGILSDQVPGVQYLKKIFMARADIGAAVYCCSPSVALFSAASEPLAPTGDEGKHFEGSAFTLAMDQGIEEIPSHARAIFLPNEGALIVGPSLKVACLRAIFLERACSVQLDAASTGLPWGWLPDADRGVIGMTLEGQRQVDNFWDFYCRKLQRAEAGVSLPGE
jgi:L-fuculose-phosphate aldolase